MDEAKTKLAECLKTANNVLVAVSRNPSVDQLSALLGLGLFLNKEGKHCAAVFSGQIPSTLEFLKPEATIQKNTDSLRDFIIALDKSKADKLRYKVEDNVVRIFITPYRSSIGQDDLEFSQGDFNVDVVVALGVSEQADLDESITAHGRILHDATVATVNVGNNSSLGSINWTDPSASSLSELITELVQMLNPSSLDEQIATALLTGIVATTDRFSNDKTSSKTMSISSLLMGAGANQQLVATKLEEKTAEPAPMQSVQAESSESTPEAEQKKAELGTLEIEHVPEELSKEVTPEDNIELPEPEDQPKEEVDEPSMPPAGLKAGPKLVTEPPMLGGTLTANSTQNDIEPVTDPLSLATSEPPKMLDRKPDTSARAPFKPLDNLTISTTPPAGLPQLTPPPSDWSAPPAPLVSPLEPAPPEPKIPTASPAPAEDKNETDFANEVHIDENGNLSHLSDADTLTSLEKTVNSPHLQSEDNGAGAARAAVSQAFASGPDNSLPTPSPALNAQPLGPELHPENGQLPPPVPPPFNPTLS